MPEVRRYGVRKVGTDPLQGGRRTAAETPTSTGAGLAQAEGQRAESLAHLGGVIGQFGASQQARIWEEERRRADEVAAMDVDTRLGQWTNKRMYDPETGALNVRGKDALPLPEQVMGEFNDVAGEVERGLTTDRQRAAFQRIKAQHAEQLDVQLRRHVFQEMRAYDAGVVEATVETAHESAIANAPDSRRVDIEMKKAVSAITGAAKTQGWSPEVVQKKVDDVQSATMVGVINNLLAADNTTLAKQYFTDNKDLLKGNALTQVQKALEVGGQRAEAQQQTDEILAAGGTLTEQRDKAKAIQDPEVRDLVQQRLEHESAVRDREQRETEEKTMIAMYNILDKAPDVRNIPPAVWANLPGNARVALEQYATRLTKGETTTDDAPTYYALILQSTDDPTTFVKQNLLNYHHKLSDSSFKKLADIQASLRKNDGKAEKVLDGVRSDTQIFTDTMLEAGIDKDSKQAAQLRRLWEQRVDAAQRGETKLGGSEKQQILDDMWQSVILKPGGWANILPGGEPFYPVTKPVRELSIGDIPTADRTLIEQRLRSRNRPVTDDSVLYSFINWKRELGEIK